MPPRKTPKLNLPRVKTDTLSDGRIGVTGDTFPIKDRLKAAGGRWHPGDKVWHLPAGTDLAFLREPLPAPVAPPPPPRPWNACCDSAKVYGLTETDVFCRIHERKPWWFCCMNATVVSAARQSHSCNIHGDPHQSCFFVRGALYTGD